MELSIVYHSQTGGKSEREGYPIIIGGTSYKMSEEMCIYLNPEVVQGSYEIAGA